MRRIVLAGLIPALTILAGCGSTHTTTLYRPPNLGPPTTDAHDTGGDLPHEQQNGNVTLRSYKPKHGNAEQANYYNASGCGTERWAVKTLTDPAANQVNLTPQETSISDLVSIAPPAGPTDRVGPTETQAFRLSGTLIFAKNESDGDVHLVVEDAQANTMIVEATNPPCAQGSLVLKQIEEVRASLIGHVPGVGSGQAVKTSLPVTVTGIGFFDRLHGQTGVAPNGIELHPLTSIQFPVSSKTAAQVPPVKLIERPGTD